MSTQPSYPPHFKLESAIRPNILALQPYRCARDDYSEGILLDANENALGHAIVPSSDGQVANGNAAPASLADDPSSLVSALADTLSLPLHRYPSPSHVPIKARIADLRFLPSPDYVFLGVGSDEVLDLLIRVFVKPGTAPLSTTVSSGGPDAVPREGLEKILTTPPTYGMYAVCAQVNDVGVVKVPLRVRDDEIASSSSPSSSLSGIQQEEGGKGGRFSLDVAAVKKAISYQQNELGNSIKLVFLCSPGNPTGTLIDLGAVEELLQWEEFKGVVIVDEAYVDFVGGEDEDEKVGLKKSAASLVEKYANLVVVQTLSKSFGLAGIRLGIALSQPPLIQFLSNTKAPYNVSLPTAQLAQRALSAPSLVRWREHVRTLKRNRQLLIQQLEKLREKEAGLGVGPIIGSNDANFVLVRILEKGSSGTPSSQAKADSARARKIYTHLAEQMGVVVRYRGNELGCDGALRITVGTEQENAVVLEKLEEALNKI